jgi:hypothetical protein
MVDLIKINIRGIDSDYYTEARYLAMKEQTSIGKFINRALQNEIIRLKEKQTQPKIIGNSPKPITNIARR